MYKTGHAFSYLLLKESVDNDVINVSFAQPFARILLDQSVVNHAIDEWRRHLSRPVSMLKADILNITYDCYSQNNNVEMAAL